MRTSLRATSRSSSSTSDAACASTRTLQLTCHELSAVCGLFASATLGDDHGRAELRKDRPADARTNAPAQLCNDDIVQRRLGGHGCRQPLDDSNYGASMAAWRSHWPLGYAWALSRRAK